MKHLFIFDRHLIKSILKNYLHIKAPIFNSVVSEYHGHDLSCGNRFFNCDFEYCFYDQYQRPENNISTAASILPRTLGAEVFVIFERETYNLVNYVLMCGTAFPIKYYKPYIHLAESVIRESITNGISWVPSGEQYSEDHQKLDLRLEQLPTNISFNKYLYLRIFVVEGVIYFMYFPFHSLPVHKGTRYTLNKTRNSRIDCCFDHNEDHLVCLEGWVPSPQVVENGWKLVATKE